MMLVPILLLVALGLAVYFTGNPAYETIDRPVVNALAGASCPQCGTTMGLPFRSSVLPVQSH